MRKGDLVAHKKNSELWGPNNSEQYKIEAQNQN
jgi:hypothetical protein